MLKETRVPTFQETYLPGSDAEEEAGIDALREARFSFGGIACPSAVESIL